MLLFGKRQQRLPTRHRGSLADCLAFSSIAASAKFTCTFVHPAVPASQLAAEILTDLSRIGVLYSRLVDFSGRDFVPTCFSFFASASIAHPILRRRDGDHLPCVIHPWLKSRAATKRRRFEGSLAKTSISLIRGP
jgi:hypothetical protein